MTNVSTRIPDQGIRVMVETINVLKAQGSPLSNPELDIRVAENLGLPEEAGEIRANGAYRSGLRSSCSSARTYFNRYGYIKNSQGMRGFWELTTKGKNMDISENNMKNIYNKYYNDIKNKKTINKKNINIKYNKQQINKHLIKETAKHLSYKVEGLRSLKSMPFVELVPITILVGLNNSGKSTFLRSFPLLKQSVESKSSSAISWNAGLVNFGNFSTSLNRKIGNKPEEIKFSFEFSDVATFGMIDERWDFSIHHFLQYLIYYLFPTTIQQRHLIHNVQFSVAVGNYNDESGNNLTVMRKIEMRIPNFEFNVELSFSEDGQFIENFKLDGIELSDIIPFDSIIIQNNPFFCGDLTFQLKEEHHFFDENINKHEETKENIQKNKTIVRKYNLNNFVKLICSVILQIDSYEFIDNMPYLKNIFQSGQKIYEYLIKHGFNRENPSDEFEIILDSLPKDEKIFLMIFGKLVLFWLAYQDFQSMLEKLSRELNYLGPIRAENKRICFIQEGNNEIDSTGENLPNFFASVSDDSITNFSKWIKRLYGFSLKVEKESELVKISIDFDGQVLNLADTGVGISQLLPVLAKIWWAKQKCGKKEVLGSYQRVIALEQPELHLHPVQQANLVDAFIDIATEKDNSELDNPRLIVETHSEKLISRFSKRIKEGKISHNDVQVVLFESKDPDKPLVSNVRLCPFNEHGTLDDWQYGFFNSG